MDSKNSQGAVVRAAAYIRVSSSDQVREGLSLPEQRRRIEAHIAAQGWTLIDAYEDAGLSGRRSDRPELRRLLADLPAIDRVVITRLDRLGRSSVHLHLVYGELERAGTALVSLSENLDSSTATGKLLRTVLAAVAEMESDNISERVRSVTEARARRGRHHGGPDPYGYEHLAGELIVNTIERPVVERIAREFVAGRSQKEICRRLNADGIRTKRGGRWTQPVVARILANPIYAGKIRLNGETYDGAHEPILSEELWGQVQATRDALARTKGGGRRRPSAGSHLFIHGLLKCGRCGASMVPRSIRPRSKTGKFGEWYVCATRIADVTACGQTPIDRRTVDEAAYDYFTKVGLDVAATKAQIVSELDAKVTDTRTQREGAEMQLKLAESRFDRVRRDYQDGHLAADDWHDQRVQLLDEKTAAAAEVERLLQREGEIATDPLIDCDDVLLDHLTEIRAAIVGDVRNAQGLDAARMAILRIFDGFTLTTNTGGEKGSLAVGGYLLRPHVREGALNIKVVGDPGGSVCWPFHRTGLFAGVNKANDAFTT
jgi:site-specific DNA recombinase